MSTMPANWDDLKKAAVLQVAEFKLGNNRPQSEAEWLNFAEYQANFVQFAMILLGKDSPQTERLLRDLQQNLSLERGYNPNGADTLTCPCCGDTASQTGGQWIEPEHEADCAFVRLRCLSFED